ncbi:Polycomb protein eed-B, partial [Lachnellula cervina]
SRESNITHGLTTAQARVGTSLPQRISSNADFYCVQFYPYTEPGIDPVFAIVGGKHILICRPPAAENTKIEVTQYCVDEETNKDKNGADQEEDYYTCVWTKDFETGDPLLCVAGLNATIKIINALTGKLLRTLSGHGGEINDLVISPTNPYILASASNDLNVRIWSLDPAHEKQPCAAILEGDGHREAVMSLTFHATSQYLLTGGVDHIINLTRTLALTNQPESTTLTSPPRKSTKTSVAFYGDLIISKAANENCIVLWSINNFNSTNPLPTRSSAPTTHDAQRDTRSVFTTSSAKSTQYTRLLQFSIPDSEILFMRFSLFPGGLGMNPVLAFCNTNSKVFFWDMSRLEAYHDATADGADIKDPNTRPAFLNPFQHRNRIGAGGGGGAVARLHRAASPAESSSTGGDEREREKEKEKGRIDWEKSIKGWVKKYEMNQPLESLDAHKEEVVKGLGFTGRYIAWSRDGQWCVVVGSAGVFALLQRWGR